MKSRNDTLSTYQSAIHILYICTLRNPKFTNNGLSPICKVHTQKEKKANYRIGKTKTFIYFCQPKTKMVP